MQQLDAIPLYDGNGNIISFFQRKAARADATITWSPVATGLGSSFTAGWAQWMNAPYNSNADQRLTAPYIQSVTFFAGSSTKGNKLSSVPFRQCEGDWKSSRFTISQNYERYEKLFDVPNDRTTGVEFWKTHSINRDLFGEAMWVFLDANRKPTTIDKAAELWHLNPSEWVPDVNKETDKIERWVLIKDKTKSIEAEFVYQFKEPNPYNPYRGLSRAAVAGLTMETDNQMKIANKNFVSNGFNLGGILTGDDWDSTQSGDVAKSIQETHAGPTKQGRMLVIGGNGIKFFPNSTNHKGMQYIEGLAFNREEILSILGVPESWVARGGNLNFATASAEDYIAWTGTMLPIMEEVKNVLWARHFRNLGGKQARWMQFDYNSVPALRDALLNTKLDVAKKYIDLGYPINFVNEHLELGMASLPWGGEAFANGAVRPLSLLMNAGDVPNKEQFAASNEAAIKTPTAAPNAASGQNATNEGETRSDDVIPREDTEGKIRRAEAWRKLAASILVPNEKRFAESMRAYFNNQRNEVIKNLRTLPARSDSQRDFSDAEIEKILFNLEEWNQKLIKRANPLYKAIAEDVTKNLEAELGALAHWSESNPAVSAIIDIRGGKLVDVNDSVRESLRELLIKASEQNLTINDTAKAISEMYQPGGAIGRERALKIARTETASAANAMRNEAFSVEGIERVEWTTARDSAVRDSHESLDGELRAVGESFSNGLQYPGDPSGPAEEVVNCRCVTIPVISNN